MEQIVAALIGGFLAAGTGWFLQTRLEISRTNKIRELLITGICDDLDHSLDLYEKIEEEWDKTKIVWFSTLDELKESRQTYKDNKNWIVLFGNKDTRKRIFKYYLKSTELIDSLEYQQRRKYELENKFNGLVSDIKLRSPGLMDEDANALAESYMKAEDTEYRRLQNRIPETVIKLNKFRVEAEELIKILSNIKS
ncbi:MAG: hypothetical protein ACXV7J_06600 [Methylomonas sp.]